MKGKRGCYSMGGEAPKSPAVTPLPEEKGSPEAISVYGDRSRSRADRPGRKMGGRCGADLAPLSSAAKSVAEPYAKGGSVKGNWIAGAVKNKGALHKSLGVPKGEKIPAKKLEKATHSDNPTLAKRARLAETLRGFKK